MSWYAEFYVCLYISGIRQVAYVCAVVSVSWCAGASAGCATSRCIAGKLSRYSHTIHTRALVAARMQQVGWHVYAQEQHPERQYVRVCCFEFRAGCLMPSCSAAVLRALRLLLLVAYAYTLYSLLCHWLD